MDNSFKIGGKMANTKTLLGNRIRTLRRIKNYSQEEFAEKAEISSKYVGEIERGQANLTIEIIEKISIALDIELTDLFDFQHEQKPQILKKQINSFLKNATDQDIQMIFRVIKTILN